MESWLLLKFQLQTRREGGRAKNWRTLKIEGHYEVTRQCLCQCKSDFPTCSISLISVILRHFCLRKRLWRYWNWPSRWGSRRGGRSLTRVFVPLPGFWPVILDRIFKRKNLYPPGRWSWHFLSVRCAVFPFSSSHRAYFIIPGGPHSGAGALGFSFSFIKNLFTSPWLSLEISYFFVFLLSFLCSI